MGTKNAQGVVNYTIEGDNDVILCFFMEFLVVFKIFFKTLQKYEKLANFKKNKKAS